jgi:hypothetical protein
VWILDRPNTVGGPVEGLMLNARCESSVGSGAMPMRHGLTLGELARWFVETLHLDVFFPLEVRSIAADDAWLSPFGKLHSLTARDFAPLYPRWSEAMNVRRMLDPAGRLLNPYFKRLLDND